MATVTRDSGARVGRRGEGGVSGDWPVHRGSLVVRVRMASAGPVLGSGLLLLGVMVVDHFSVLVEHLAGPP